MHSDHRLRLRRVSPQLTPILYLSSMLARHWLAVVAGLSCCCRLAQSQVLLASGRIAGRYDPSTGLATLPLVIDWPSTTIWTAFQNSDRVNVRIEAQPGWAASVNTGLAFVLDGQEEVVYVTSLPYTWSRQGLSQGKHQLQIIKRTETLYGIVVLADISVSSSGR